jgi:hypothetical protein
MRHVLKVFILATVVCMCAPASAHADGYISPFIGVNFGNPSGNGRADFGFNAGYMGAGIIGGELDFGYAPSFFGNQGTYGSNYVTDVMGNLIIGIPVGGTWGPGVRPYGTIGLGLLHEQVSAGPTGALRISNNDFALNAGVGLMGYFSHHVGLRGDVRYFRTLKSGTTNPNSFGIDFGAFHYWRASFGVVVRP